jgi:hypothetical protein
MNIVVTSIKDPGTLQNERVVLRVELDCKLGRYVLIRAQSSSKNLLGGPIEGFWLPNVDVKAGDLVVLYTKSGRRKTKDREENKTHFVYWGKDEPLWGSPNFGAAVGLFSDWDSYRLGGFDSDADIESD